MKLTKNTIGKIVAVVLIAIFFNSELQGCIGSLGIQLTLFANNYFFLSLFFDGFTPTNNQLPILDMGSTNLLKLKLIYVARFLGMNQFLFSEIANDTLADIERRLEAQFLANGWDSSTFDNLDVPSMRWGEIDPETFLKTCVIPGIPCIIKDVPSGARDKWNPAYFASHYGQHNIEVINTNTVSVLQMNISRYVAAHTPAVRHKNSKHNLTIALLGGS
jgi:hypothetical protein